MKILLAEDDNNLRETLAEGLRAEGYEVMAVANGAAAMEVIGNGWNVAVLDGLLPKMTGFDVAKNLRSRSPETAVILMSGVFKGGQQQADHIAATGAKAYLVKPFDVKRLVDAIRPYAPSPGAAGGAGQVGGGEGEYEAMPMPAEGNLLEMPALFLGWRIFKEGHTGILDLWGNNEKARIFAYKGRAVFAQSSDSLHHIGVELLKDGSITSEQYKHVTDLCMQRGVGLYEVLKSEGLATDVQMKALYKGLVPRIIERTPALVGRFRWTATDAFSSIVPAASSSLFDSMLAGVARATEKELEPHVTPRRPLRLAPGDNWVEVTSLLPQACGSDSLMRAINGRATVAQMIEVSPTPQERATRFRQVFVLMSTMAVIASESVIAMSQPAAAPPPPAPTPAPPPVAAPAAPSAGSKVRPTATASDAGVRFTQAETDARSRIETKFKELEGKNHWEVLGVKREADANAVKKAYYALSRDFHPDSFAGLNLGSAQQKLEHVFGVIQDANDTLTNDAKRGEYEAKMSLEAGGGSSDIGALFAADSDFQKAKGLYDRGEFAGAAKIIDRVVKVMATNEEAKGFKLFFDWWATKNAANATKVIADLNALYKAAPAQHALLDFQGWIYLEIGNLKSARSSFKRVVDAEPKHIGANRGLTATNRKLEEEAKSANTSALGKFFGKQ